MIDYCNEEDSYAVSIPCEPPFQIVPHSVLVETGNNLGHMLAFTSVAIVLIIFGLIALHYVNTRNACPESVIYKEGLLKCQNKDKNHEYHYAIIDGLAVEWKEAHKDIKGKF